MIGRRGVVRELQNPNYEWAIIYLPGFQTAPFLKVPLVVGTYLYAQACFGLEKEARFPVVRGSINKGVVASYRLFMLAHSEFLRHLDKFVEILNGFHKYCLTTIDSTMPPETAYALCTSILPGTTNKKQALEVLLTEAEFDAFTGLALSSLKFSPTSPATESVERRAMESSLAEAADKVRRSAAKVKKLVAPPEKVTEEGEVGGEVKDPRAPRHAKPENPLDLPLPGFSKDVPKPDPPNPEDEILLLSEIIDFGSPHVGDAGAEPPGNVAGGEPLQVPGGEPLQVPGGEPLQVPPLSPVTLEDIPPIPSMEGLDLIPEVEPPPEVAVGGGGAQDQHDRPLQADSPASKQPAEEEAEHAGEGEQDEHEKVDDPKADLPVESLEKMMELIRKLQEENVNLRKQLTSKEKKRKASSSSSEPGEDVEEPEQGGKAQEEVVIIEADQPKDLKWRIIESAIPLSSNEGFLNILGDGEGREILSKILDEEIRRFALLEAISFDTSATAKGEPRLSRTFASKLVHVLFSEHYIFTYKFYDRRENYKQKPGTAMHEEVYTWLESVVTESIKEFHRVRDRENPFNWDEFLVNDLRIVWRWTRSNITKKRNKLKRAKH